MSGNGITAVGRTLPFVAQCALVGLVLLPLTGCATQRPQGALAAPQAVVRLLHSGTDDPEYFLPTRTRRMLLDYAGPPAQLSIWVEGVGDMRPLTVELPGRKPVWIRVVHSLNFRDLTPQAGLALDVRAVSGSWRTWYLDNDDTKRYRAAAEAVAPQILIGVGETQTLWELTYTDQKWSPEAKDVPIVGTLRLAARLQPPDEAKTQAANAAAPAAQTEPRHRGHDLRALCVLRGERLIGDRDGGV